MATLLHSSIRFHRLRAQNANIYLTDEICLFSFFPFYTQYKAIYLIYSSKLDGISYQVLNVLFFLPKDNYLGKDYAQLFTKWGHP